METPQKTPLKDVSIRAIAILGLVAVLLLGAWGIIQLAVSIPTLLGTIGGGVSALFTRPAQTEPVQDTKAVSAPTTTKTATKATVKTTVSKNTSTSPAAPRPALWGLGDLAVYINSVSPAGNGLTAITFTIENIGTNSIAGGWVFNANLPINGSYIFTSQPQHALNPGDKVVYTLTYSNSNAYTGGQSSYICNGYLPCFQPSHDPIDYGYGNYNLPAQAGYSYRNGPVTITADPQNVVWESNESNNIVRSY
jgi:hypothetical protein